MTRPNKKISTGPRQCPECRSKSISNTRTAILTGIWVRRARLKRLRVRKTLREPSSTWLCRRRCTSVRRLAAPGLRRRRTESWLFLEKKIRRGVKCAVWFIFGDFPKKICTSSPSSSGGTSLEMIDLIAMNDVPFTMSTSGAKAKTNNDNRCYYKKKNFVNVQFFFNLVPV